MTRFFATPDMIGEKTITLRAEDTEHIRSLRLRPDELFIVCDGNSTDYICRLGERRGADDSRGSVSIADILESRPSVTEPSVKCNVFLAYQKGERLDYAVQKSVELGAHSIWLYSCSRCVSRPNDITKRVERLQRVVLERAKLSQRGIVPEVSNAGGFGNMIDIALSHSDLSLLFYEDEKNLHLMTVLQHHFPGLNHKIKHPVDKVKSIAIITGPEGGFESFEVNLAKSSDIPVLTLGPRIMRAETAPVAALSAIMYHTGNL